MKDNAVYKFPLLSTYGIWCSCADTNRKQIQKFSFNLSHFHHTKPTALLLRLCAVISAYILHYHIKLAHYKTAIKLHLASARVAYYYYKLLRVDILIIKNNLLLREKISTNYNSSNCRAVPSGLYNTLFHILYQKYQFLPIQSMSFF